MGPNMWRIDRRVIMQIIVQSGLRSYIWNLGAVNDDPGSTSQEWLQGAGDRKAAITLVPEGED